MQPGDTERDPSGRRENESRKLELPELDLSQPDALKKWFKRVEISPFENSKEKKNPDGTPYTYEQQVEDTKDQVSSFATKLVDRWQKGKKQVGGPENRTTLEQIAGMTKRMVERHAVPKSSNNYSSSTAKKVA